MVGDVKTDETVCVALSIRMVVKCRRHNGQTKTDEQKQGKFSMLQRCRRCRNLWRVEAFSQG